MTAVTARAPGKINVFLHVGDRMDDGYHELVTVFQALDMYEEVTLRPCFDQPDTVVRNISGNDTYPGLSPVHAVTLKGRFGSTAIPLDHSNLAVSAINRLAAQTGVHVPVEVEIEKNVPVAGGMGGGSADAAAALVAYAKLAGINDPDLLRTVGAELGADVPFALRVPRSDRLQHIRQLRLHVTGVRRLAAVTQVVQGVVDHGGGKFVDRGGKHPGELAGA